MTSHQRLVVAIRHGVMVKRSDTMKYTADVTPLGVVANRGREFTLTPIEAAHEMDAARQAAAIAATELYGPTGQASFVNSRGPGLFLASIGLYHRHALGGVTNGSSVSIKVMRRAEAERA